jgi:predicted nucleic acid-binding protein
LGRGAEATAPPARTIAFGARESSLVAAVAVPDPPETVDAVSGDPGDDVVLASALAAGAEVLATGDRRHLLPLETHRGLRILTPQALLAELGGR